MPLEQQDQNTAENALENLRKRLLDLTGRNRLLNFKHTKRCLRIIDELPDQLTKMLLDGTTMRFRSVPEPTMEELVEAGYFEIDDITKEEKRLRGGPDVKEWANRQGLNTSYEVPQKPLTETVNGRYKDKYIQTLFYPHELGPRLENIRQPAESAIQEMGANILYLAFGYLEWFEHDNDKPRIAPLFLIPVRLEKGQLNQSTRTYEYTITYSGEDIIRNLSLKEKLRVDFAMALPELDENTSPEKYFEEVLDLIQKNKPRWRLRRYITLALLNFSKLLMYLDLDPSRWPENGNLINHPTVGRFLASYGAMPDENGDFGFGEEHSIDEVDDVHEKYPLINDADSSQHSALIDAVDGRNLVIEGPPGTGKSQTITNLIAVAMARGKRILFVAEKLAALEVVYHRLDIAGLGDFCLELHSHKSQKQKIIGGIKDRLDNKGDYPDPKDIETDIARYEKFKTELNNHVRQINQLWKGTGKTLHEIFMGASRYRNAVDVSPEVLRPEKWNGNNLDVMTQQRMEDQVAMFRTFYQDMVQQLDEGTELQNHPWHGVRNVNLRTSDNNRVVETLREWQNSLKSVIKERDKIAEWLDCEPSEIANNLDEVPSFLDNMEKLPPLNGDELIDRLPILRGETLEGAQRYLKLFEHIQSLYAELTEKVDSQILQNLSGVDDFVAGGEQIKQLVDPSIKLETLKTAINKMKEIENQIDELNKQLIEINNVMGEGVARYLSPTKEGLAEFDRFIGLVTCLKPSDWKHRDERFDNDELDDLLPELRDELEALHKLREELQTVFRINSLPNHDELRKVGETINTGGIFCWVKSDWLTARRQVRRMAANYQVKFSSLRALLETATEFSQKRQKLNGNSQYQEAFGKHMEGLNTDLATLERLRDWYKKVRKQYGVGFGQKVAFGDAMFGLPAETARAIRLLSDQGVCTQLSSLQNDLVEYRKIFSPFHDLQNDNAMLAGKESVISRLLVLLDESHRRCIPLMQDGTISISELTGRINLLSSLKETIGEWKDKNCDNEIFQGRLGLEIGVEADNASSLSILRNTLDVASSVDDASTSNNIQRKIYAEPDASTFNALKLFSMQLKKLVDTQEDQYVTFVRMMDLDLDKDDWITTSSDYFDGLISKNIRALDSIDTLQNWLDYVRARNKVIEMGLAGLVEAVEQRSMDIQCIDDAYKSGIFDVLAREILDEKPGLDQFSVRSHKSIQDRFREYDDRLKKLQRAKIAWQIDQTEIPRGNYGARVSEYTEKVLLEHECNKRTRHLPIRRLLLKAGNALVALKPCFMMGPMSVAQYLDPGHIEFDLVIMDEASQIKPQDALGAIARGKQLVVVGDPKQLPPTSFFDRVIGEEEEDPTAIEESESILDATWPMFPKRRLRWHYRSKHESLIQFSNHSFYRNDLILFPSPYQYSDSYGVQLKLVRGCFINRKNMEEVKDISGSVREHLMKKPEESLGVVAMNLEQRRAIEDAIETLARENDEFRVCYEENSRTEEPLFIKNLENVQGDERDVIFISMTYGPQERGGKVPQRFGPINTDTGWRRLNVLFTRAKKHMRIFTSMESHDIVVGAKTRRGVHALHDFLAFCKTGSVPQGVERETGRSPGSDFEIMVMEELENEGFKCVPQVGVAGFFIDVAVVDPGNPGRFLMGIECDGATYHSAKSARDRDRLRQEILEDKGWIIHRIWSTDWFKNPDAQLKPIIEKLREFGETVKPTAVESKEMAEEIGQQMILLEKFISDETEIEQKLYEFDRKIIRQIFPDTPNNKRLLRPAMLEALLEYEPTSKSEFLEYIPGYLRQSTSTEEAKEFLEHILNMINSSAEEDPH